MGFSPTLTWIHDNSSDGRMISLWKLSISFGGAGNLHEALERSWLRA